MSLYVWLFALACMVLLDIAWALYTTESAAKRPMHAASWAVALTALGSVNTIVIVDDPRYLSATLTGAFIGTFIGVAWAKRQEKKA